MLHNLTVSFMVAGFEDKHSFGVRIPFVFYRRESLLRYNHEYARLARQVKVSGYCKPKYFSDLIIIAVIATGRNIIFLITLYVIYKLEGNR